MKDFIDFLKLPPNILGALSIASGTLLLLPQKLAQKFYICLLYTSPSPRDMRRSRMPSSA